MLCRVRLNLINPKVHFGEIMGSVEVYLYGLYVFIWYFLLRLGVSFGLKELGLFEKVVNKYLMRNAHLIGACVGLISLSALWLIALVQYFTV